MTGDYMRFTGARTSNCYSLITTRTFSSPYPAGPSEDICYPSKNTGRTPAPDVTTIFPLSPFTTRRNSSECCLSLRLLL
ncbi:hypothetical protein CDAR_428071 [Caerostris darwini]|uniref:Uncharacterized protein n=1 Tax=Caerostris darwini TaxID=1538125 RepID=A0AAV4Q4C5_9ARAC|nr:hypothetical protein CDAR_428071 [Caerostris darwini]